MSKAEIEELLELKGWSTAGLADRLQLKENTVERWLVGDRNPSGPACVLMRMWLAEAKQGRRKESVAS